MAEYPKCNHPKQEVRYVDQEKAGRWYFLECLVCGERMKRLSANSVTNKNSVKPHDESIRKNYLQWSYAEYDKRIQAERNQEKEKFDRWYSEYLKSPAWRQKRELVLQRSRGICEGCMKNKATEVHHKTYERVGQEMLFDLVAICSACHASIHGTRPTPHAPDAALAAVKAGEPAPALSSIKPAGSQAAPVM